MPNLFQQAKRAGAISRRSALGSVASGILAASVPGCATLSRRGVRMASFTADVTVPVGHGMMGGAWLSRSITDPLEAHGIVLVSEEAPVVFLSVDWCEIRNDAYFRWQNVLAEAAGTTPGRVMITTVHQHDAPVADLTAERILREKSLAGTICDLDFHERAVQEVARNLRHSLSNLRPLTHVVTNQARVSQIACNRRYTLPTGELRFDRTSSTRNEGAIAAPEGLVDPFLKTLTFLSGDDELASLAFYAVHPMSYYGAGEVSADFPGVARRKIRASGRKLIYCSGCSGNVTAGKYNRGTPADRAALATRLHDAIVRSLSGGQRYPVARCDFRLEPLALEPRQDKGFSIPELESRLIASSKPFDQCLAAMGLSWQRRIATGHPLQLPLLDLGSAQLLVLPGETYVEFQLAAQRFCPDRFICVAGYGDGATGYIPTDAHFQEGDTNLSDWCWVAPGSEARLLHSLRRLLRA